MSGVSDAFSFLADCIQTTCVKTRALLREIPQLLEGAVWVAIEFRDGRDSSRVVTKNWYALVDDFRTLPLSQLASAMPPLATFPLE